MIMFDDSLSPVIHYMTYGFVFSMVVNAFVVLGGMALRVLKFGSDFDISK